LWRYREKAYSPPYARKRLVETPEIYTKNARFPRSCRIFRLEKKQRRSQEGACSSRDALLHNTWWFYLLSTG